MTRRERRKEFIKELVLTILTFIRKLGCKLDLHEWEIVLEDKIPDHEIFSLEIMAQSYPDSKKIGDEIASSWLGMQVTKRDGQWFKCCHQQCKYCGQTFRD